MKYRVGAIVAALTLCGGLAQAAILAEWENDDLAASSTSATADTVNASASVSTLTAWATNAGYPDVLAGIHNAASVNSLAASITSGDYFSFTLTPDAGVSVSYSDLFWRYTVQANSQPAITVFTLMSSETGFTSSDAIASIAATATVGGVVSGTGTFDITGTSALQSVAAGTAVEFRIYIHNNGANAMTRVGNGHAFFTDALADLTLNGTTATGSIPTLSEWGLIILVVLLAVVGGRRAMKRSALNPA